MATRPHGVRLRWWAGNSCQFRNPLPPFSQPFVTLRLNSFRPEILRPESYTFGYLQKMVGCKVSRQRATTEPLHQKRRKKAKRRKKETRKF
jgi:hypothetical protein